MKEPVKDKEKEETQKASTSQDVAESTDSYDNSVEGACSAEFSQGCLVKEE
ncbi:MAG: hypothetical protein VB071_02765 [Lawsonibacter sp.]|nr:hypothetical protein [Lawsonibacter sp.]